MSSIDINIDDIEQVNKLIKALENLKNDLKNANKDIMEDISQKAVDYITNQYNMSPNRLDANIDFSSIRTTVDKRDNEYEIVVSGKDVVYEEFGTGDEGAKSPHPAKANYSLNSYNSGPYIRDVSSVSPDSYTGEDLAKIGITSGKFWYYEKDGTGHYTQGVKAGKEMWNTRNYLINDESGVKESVRKVGKEINDKFINSIT